MLHPVVAGRPMGELGEFGTVEYVEEWMHGCAEASWRTTPGTKRGGLEIGSLVEIRDKGWSKWAGVLNQPGVDGVLHARGIWTQAQTVAALDGAGDPTYIPDVAIISAINRGALRWHLRDSVSNVPAITNTADNSVGVMMVADLLDKWAEANGKRWGVNGRREVYTSGWPTLPKWIVHAAEAPLTPADDEIANVLIGKFLNAGGVHEIASVADTLSRDRWGAREVPVDLTPRGVLTAAEAISILNGLLLSGAARMGWAQSVECAPGELLTMGGTPGSSIRPGDGVRVVGAYDPTWTSAPKGYIDIVANKVTRHSDGYLTIEPAGMASRSFRDVLADALNTEAA